MKKEVTMEEMLEKAQNADFQDLVQQLKLELIGAGAQKRLKDYPTIVIDTDQNAYMDFTSGKGGSPVDFMTQLHRSQKEKEAEKLYGMMESGALKTYYNPKAFIPPEKYESNKHVYAYLTRDQGIDGEVVNSAIKRGNLYETAQERINKDGEVKQQYRCVFVGMDNDRNIKNAYVQATYAAEGKQPFQYTVKNSDINFGFAMRGHNENLFVFNDPVSAMREASLEKSNGMSWWSNHRLSLPVYDTAPIETYIKNNKGIENIYLYLPDEQTAQYHAVRLQEELQKKGFTVIPMPVSSGLEEQTATRGADTQEQARSQSSLEPAAEKKSQLKVLEENEVEDRVFVLAHDPNAEKPYFVYEAAGEEKADMESYPTRESAVEAMEDRIDQAEMEADEMER